MGIPDGSMVKNPPVKTGDLGSIPGFGRSPRVRNSNPLQILAWEIPWTEEHGRLQSIGSKRVAQQLTRLNSSSIYTDIYKRVITHACAYMHTYVLYVLMHTWIFMISRHTCPYTIYTLHIRFESEVSAVRQMRPLLPMPHRWWVVYLDSCVKASYSPQTVQYTNYGPRSSVLRYRHRIQSSVQAY